MKRGILFANGLYAIDDDENIDGKITAAEDTQDQDFKTAAVHGTRSLLKGEELQSATVLLNFYGTYICGNNPRGEYLNLDPNKLNYTAPNTNLETSGPD